MSYPTDAGTLPTNMQGTTTLADATDDHALMHREIGSAVNALTVKVGLPAGTPALNQILVGSGAGTANWATVWNQANLGSPTLTGGTINNAILGTPTIGSIIIPGTVSALGFSAAIAPGVGTLTDVAGGTLTVNAQLGNIFYCAMGTGAGNRTIATPLNITGYQQLHYAFKASGSANGTLVWGTVFRISQDSGTPALGTGTTWNYYGWRYNVIDSKFDFMGQSKNII